MGLSPAPRAHYAVFFNSLSWGSRPRLYAYRPLRGLGARRLQTSMARRSKKE